MAIEIPCAIKCTEGSPSASNSVKISHLLQEGGALLQQGVQISIQYQHSVMILSHGLPQSAPETDATNHQSTSILNQCQFQYYFHHLTNSNVAPVGSTPMHVDSGKFVLSNQRTTHMDKGDRRRPGAQTRHDYGTHVIDTVGTKC